MVIEGGGFKKGNKMLYLVLLYLICNLTSPSQYYCTILLNSKRFELVLFLYSGGATKRGDATKRGGAKFRFTDIHYSPRALLDQELW